MSMNNSLKPLQLLLVNGDEHDVKKIRQALKKSMFEINITHYNRAEEALDAADRDASFFDLGVIDNKLPGMSGFDLCKTLIEKEVPFPLLILTGVGSENLAVEALKAGVDDYVAKDLAGAYLDLLPLVITRALDRTFDRNVRKHTEEALRKQCDFLNRILNGIFERVAVIDRDFKIREVNNCFEKQYGKNREQILGSYCYQVTHNRAEPCSGDMHPCPMVSVFETRESFHAEHIHIDRKGEKRIVEVSAYPIFDASGEVESIVEINFDITRRKRDEEKLSESEERWRSLAENAPTFITIINRDHDIQYINRTVPGLSTKEVIGKNVYDFITPGYHNLARESFENVFNTGKTESFTSEAAGPNGSFAWYENHLGPIRTKGDVVGVTIIATDITRRKQAEDQLKTALKEKEVLLKEIHHRVKNNFQTISSLLSLQSLYIKDEQTLELFKNSQGRIKTMTLIHEKLYESGDLSKIDFNEYIQSLTAYIFDSSLLQPGQVRLKIKIKKDIYLNIDTAIPIGLIINELVSNSLKYAFPENRKGDIRIILEDCIDKKYDYTLIVADNGVGIMEDIDFKNSNSLGMSIIYALVEQLYGNIDLDIKRGTTFTIKFKKLKDKK